MAKTEEQKLWDYCNALMNAMDSSRNSKKDDVWLFSSFKTFMRKYNELAQLAVNTLKVQIPVDIYNIDKVPSAYDTTTIQQRIYFDEVYTNLSILKSFVESHGGLAEAQADDILNFLKSNLRKAIFSEPSNEKEVQNSIESLLVGKGLQKGISYDRETGRVKHSGKESIPDFIFPPENMALEVKICNRNKLSSLIDEMNADIVAYSSKYERVWFLIYDIGLIRDENEIIDGLQKHEGVKCAIVKH
jgi:hypothetical protein